MVICIPHLTPVSTGSFLEMKKNKYLQKLVSDNWCISALMKLLRALQVTKQKKCKNKILLVYEFIWNLSISTIYENENLNCYAFFFF